MAIAPKHSIAIDNSREQLELLLSGLVVKDQSKLRIRNPIYAAVFDAVWVQHQLDQMRPYAVNIREWLNSNRQDESRLLQGKALKEAEGWADGKRIDDQDYQFLAASRALNQIKQEQALQVARVQELEARLARELKVSKLQRLFLVGTVVALAVTTSLALHSKRQSYLHPMPEQKNEICKSSQK